MKYWDVFLIKLLPGASSCKSSCCLDAAEEEDKLYMLWASSTELITYAGAQAPGSDIALMAMSHSNLLCCYGSLSYPHTVQRVLSLQQHRLMCDTIAVHDAATSHLVRHLKTHVMV